MVESKKTGNSGSSHIGSLNENKKPSSGTSIAQDSARSVSKIQGGVTVTNKQALPPTPPRPKGK